MTKKLLMLTKPKNCFEIKSVFWHNFRPNPIKNQNEEFTVFCVYNNCDEFICAAQ